MNIAILGAGAWGTAVALSSWRAHHTVTLITKNAQDAAEINTHHENITFFPGIEIPEAITVTHRYDGLKTCDVLFLVCPSAAIDDVGKHIQEAGLPASVPIISFCKGLPGETWELPSMYISRRFPSNPFGVLSGPSYAREVALGLPTTVVLASKNPDCRNLAFQFPNMTILPSEDVIGVELGGCLKNIYAIGAGIFDGLQLGMNAKCSYMMTCLQEMIMIGQKLGAQTETFYGPSGIGDFLATCSGSWSRNRTFGESLIQDYDPHKLFTQSVAAIEGYRSVKTFHHIFEEKSIPAPVVNALYQILYGGTIQDVADIKTTILAAVFPS